MLTSAHLAHSGKQGCHLWDYPESFPWLPWIYLGLLSKTYIRLCRFLSTFSLFLPLFPFLYLVKILRTCLDTCAWGQIRLFPLWRSLTSPLRFVRGEGHSGFGPMTTGVISPHCLGNSLSLESQSPKSSPLSLRIKSGVGWGDLDVNSLSFCQRQVTGYF